MMGAWTITERTTVTTAVAHDGKEQKDAHLRSFLPEPQLVTRVEMYLNYTLIGRLKD